jgi:cullin 1
MILKLFDVLEHLESQGPQKPLITNQEYVNSYTLVYQMCTQRSPSNYSQPVYERHDEILKHYSRTKVLKSLQEKTGVHMLKEVGRRWGHHQQLDSWMKRFLQYIDRYFVSHHNLQTLQETCECSAHACLAVGA